MITGRTTSRSDANVTYDCQGVMGNLVVTIHLRRRYWTRFRTRIGFWIMGLGARIVGCGIKVAEPAADDEDEEPTE